MSQILRIETAGPARKARRLYLADGTEPRLTSAAVVRRLGLVEGASFDHTELEQLLAAEEPSAAKERALALLGYRERSVCELRQGLRDSGYGEAVIAPVVARLADLGLVDDGRFAELWIRSRLASSIGRRRIEQELIRKGVDHTLVEAAFQEAEGTVDDEKKRARAALGRRTASSRKERERLIRRLVNRGFELSVALEAVDEAVGDAPDAP
jgi:regulatory protein